MTILYTDIDSTVLNFNIPWERFIRSQGVEIPYEGFMQGQCRLTDALGLDEEYEFELLGSFFASNDFYSLPAIDGAPEAFKTLYGNGWRFVAISACPEGDSVLAGRKANLEHTLNVPFEQVISTGVGGCKRNVLSQFEPTVWVDDHHGNAIAGHELGYQTFLYNQAHNEHHTNVPMTRARNWREIVDRLCMEN